MRAPNYTEALIGAGGGVLGAVLAGTLALVPWIFPNKAPSEELRDDIVSGIEGLKDISDPSKGLKQIKVLEDLLELEPAFHYQRILQRHRQELETIIRQREIADQTAKVEADKIAALEAAKARADTDAEKAELTRRAEDAAAAAAAAEAEKTRLDAEAAIAAQNARDALQREKAAAPERIQAIQNVIRDERVCTDSRCTSWILR